MPHLPPLAAAIVTISGVVLAVIRLLTASKAFWWRFPEWLQKGLPAALVALGTLPAALEASKSYMDVAVAFTVAIGAWFTASRGDQRPVLNTDGTRRTMGRAKSDPRGIPAGPLLGLIFCCSLLTLRCGIFAAEWPKIAEHCAPSDASLVQDVEAVLRNTGDVEAQLEQIAVKETKAAVECAVQQLVGDLSGRMGAARDDHSLARGRAFLAKVKR